MPPKTIVRAVTFEQDGSIEITYLNTDDVKANGLIMSRLLVVPPTGDYLEEIEDLHQVVVNVLDDAIEDHERLEPVDVVRPSLALVDDEDDDDE